MILLLGLPALALGAWFVSTRLLVILYQRFDQIPEYLFLLAIGWCLGVAELATVIGLSHEVGAFIAGVTLATSPIARFIAESLKPLRDFFLVLFFFALGAGFDIGGLTTRLGTRTGACAGGDPRQALGVQAAAAARAGEGADGR